VKVIPADMDFSPVGKYDNVILVNLIVWEKNESFSKNIEKQDIKEKLKV